MKKSVAKNRDEGRPFYSGSGEPRRILVIGAGLGRTGTKSLAAALDLLGYRTYHFPLPEHSTAWAAYADGTAPAQHAIMAAVNSGYDATCDQPMADVFATQLEMFPDAKVVLTVRDSPEKWAASWRVLMEFIEVQERPFSLLYPTFIQFVPFMRNWKRMRDVMGIHLGLRPGQLVRGYKYEDEGWLERQYESHIASVREHVPKDQLLVFNVKEGWDPLCNFLEKDIPETIPFPNVNESRDLKRATTMMKVVSYCWMPLLLGTGYAISLTLRSLRKVKIS
mmetsp:Transcript_26348/g.55619  ORF Transcript_26348/g.55619 Transcript_26348/m.55619 type:complete len:279 (+) Transcript_26348:85-921(+)